LTGRYIPYKIEAMAEQKEQYEKAYYFTIGRSYGPEELKEKGSRFISYLFPANTVRVAENHITELRKKYYDATHVCPAFRLGEGSEAYVRFSDDGEPGGTAGLPIFNEIKSKDYFNVLLAVVRYYGGTKLGTGGLVRAYAAAARNVLASAETVAVHIKKELTLEFSYEFTGEVMQIVNRFNLEIISRDYTSTGTSVQLAIPLGRMEEVTRTLADISSGKLRLEQAAKK